MLIVHPVTYQASGAYRVSCASQTYGCLSGQGAYGSFGTYQAYENKWVFEGLLRRTGPVESLGSAVPSGESLSLHLAGCWFQHGFKDPSGPLDNYLGPRDYLASCRLSGIWGSIATLGDYRAIGDCL